MENSVEVRLKVHGLSRVLVAWPDGRFRHEREPGMNSSNSVMFCNREEEEKERVEFVI